MRHPRKVAVASLLLVVISFVFTREPSKELISTEAVSHTKSVSSAMHAKPTLLRGSTKPSHGPIPASNIRNAATNAPSALALRNFPTGRVFESRLEQLGANEFRRTELIETSLKYPFIRLETRFRLEKGEEILLARHEVVADHVAVALKPGFAESDLLSAIAPIGGTIRKKLNLSYSDTYLVGLPAPTLDGVPEAIEHLKTYSNLVAEVDGDGVSRKAAVIPNDSRFQYMWHFHNTGQSEGTPDADIDITEAWSLHTGSPNVIVAISDTGVNYNHSDLKGNMWTNSAERANGSDDDDNDYRDDLRGWNFYDGNKEVMDKDGHGTFVAGIIGGRANNGFGVAGVSWNCRIMAMRVLDTDGGLNSDIAEGFDYARRNGAKIINASHGGTGTTVLRTAVNNLEAAGVLLIAAAGNYSENTDSIPLDPASFPNQNVISVAATGRKDLLTSFSSYGSSTVDLAAPGSSIYSTTISNSYATESGTSFSAPLVTGVAALLQAQNPGWDCFRIRTRILNTVDRVPSLENKCVTGGRLNAYNALNQRIPLVEALDGPGLSWNTTGPASWSGSRLISYDGVDAAESGKVWHSEESRLETTMAGPGKMYFLWKVSSEASFDFLVFLVDGFEVARISGETSWAQRFHDLPAGNHTLTWKYVKDESFAGGTDNGFVDQVTFLGVPPTVVTQPVSRSVYIGANVTFSAGVNGTSPLNYQWTKEGVAIPGATLSSLTLNNVQITSTGNYSVYVSNAAGSTTSASAQLSVCNVALTPSSSAFAASGGTRTFNISLTGSCSWTATKTNSWITFNSSSSGGSGTTSFEYSVAPNESSFPRAAYLTVGNRRFLIRQSGITAPGTILGRTLAMTVTNASAALPAAGSFLLNLLSESDTNAFRIAPLTDTVGIDAGTFAFDRTGTNSAVLILNGETNYTTELRFLSPVAGTFSLQHESGETQTGYFHSRKVGLDFNNDSRNDILLQNTDGAMVAWCMQGTNLLQAVPLRNKQPTPAGWKVMAAADLMESHEPEIILQSPTGQLAAWCMTNGTNFVKSVTLRSGTSLAAGWKIVSAADFNRDGKADLILQHEDTRSAVWYMDGPNYLGVARLRDGIAPGVGWRICGSSDFDGDGQNDILWQHQDGRLQVWHFVASDFVAVTNLRTAGAAWRVVGINDFDDNGKNDILFQHQDRRLAVWFMNKTEFRSAVLLREGLPLSSSLRIAAPK